MAMNTKMRRSMSYSHIRSDSHEQKRKMRLILHFQVQRDMATTKRKLKVVGVVANVATEEL